MSYSLQRYDGSNPAALAAVADGNRYAAVLYAFDALDGQPRGVAGSTAAATRSTAIIENALFSPRARLTIAPTGDAAPQLSARRAARWRRAPRSSCRRWWRATWLPPERTFAPITGTSFVPERTVTST